MNIEDVNLANHPSLLNVWMGHARRLLKLVPNCAYYAFTDEQVRSVACQLAIWQHKRAKDGETFTDKTAIAYLSKLVPLLPGAIQEWRPGDEPALPEIPVDPVTKQLMVNPHETGDLDSQMALAKDNPRLNEHLKEIANARGSTYTRIKRLREEEEARQALRDYTYDEKTHFENVLANPNATATQRNEFAKRFPPAILKIQQREATRRITIPWHNGGNLTALMAITKGGLRTLVDAGAEVERQWIDHETQQLRKASAEAARKMETNQRLVQVK